MDIKLHRMDRFRWLIPRTGNMRVPGLIFSSDELIKAVRQDESLVQVANVAMLPGIVSVALGMPDIHWGYGFPIGGVAAFDAQEGIVSPGGVGYDINCGCRLMTTSLLADDVRASLKPLVTALFNNIPAGVGSAGPLRLSRKDERNVALQGAAWAVAGPPVSRSAAASARAGVRSVSQEQIHAAYSMGASRRQVIWHVIIPGAMPEILTAMRIAIGFGWTTLVAAEMVAARSGLGQMVLNASNFLRTDIVIMGIVVIGAVAYLFDLLMRYVERLVVPWKGKV